MRSYYEHLESLAPQEKKTPILRSSAIFPAFQGPEISTRILFLGYWQLKRNIPHIKAQVSIRDQSGKLLIQKPFCVHEPKAYQIELRDYISQEDFLGTIEVEFLSEDDLVFPYPAVVVNYLGPSFSTVVHTASRTFNDPLDAAKNLTSHVKESGFNIFATDQEEPFLALINGALLKEAQTIELEIYNFKKEKTNLKIPVKTLNPYELYMLYPGREMPLEAFLQQKPGTCKVDFHLNGVFPRLLAGNFHKKPHSIAITHTYYDCEESKSSQNFWMPKREDFYEASLMIPLMGGEHRAAIDFYPIYAPSPFAIDMEVYDENGKLLQEKEEIFRCTPPFDSFLQIPLKASSNLLAARLIARSLSNEPIPARIKIALDIGTKEKGMPCNICTNLQPFVPSFSLKASSFKWAPILADQAKSFVFLMNSSPEKAYQKEALVNLSFYREADASFLRREIKIPPQGFYFLRHDEDLELSAFFEGKPGWVTATTNNPYLTTYYFAENPSGNIGGDHGF